MSEDELREKIERAVLTEIQQPIYDASEIESSDLR